MSVSYPSSYLSKRLLLLMLVVVAGGAASLAKSLDWYAYAILDVEKWLGGSWVLHLCVATTLGYVSSWATPKRHYQHSSLPLSPWIWLLLSLVTIDEFSQMFNSNRDFSLLDLSINIGGVLAGSLIYFTYYRLRYTR